LRRYPYSCQLVCIECGCRQACEVAVLVGAKDLAGRRALKRN